MNIENSCLLQTEGYEVDFQIALWKSSENYFDAVIKFFSSLHLDKFSLESVPTFISLSDLQDLINYFGQHIAKLQQDPDAESPAFITTELGFQCQAFSGEARSPNDGEFTLQFMVNVGQSREESSRTYMGGESVVTIEQIHRFTSSLQLKFQQHDYPSLVLRSPIS